MLLGRACRRTKRELRHGHRSHPEATLWLSCVESGPREADALDDDKTIIGGVQFFDPRSLIGNSKADDLMSRTAGRTALNGLRSGRRRNQHRSREQDRSRAAADSVLRPSLLAHDLFLLNCSRNDWPEGNRGSSIHFVGLQKWVESRSL